MPTPRQIWRMQKPSSRAVACPTWWDVTGRRTLPDDTAPCPHRGYSFLSPTNLTILLLLPAVSLSRSAQGPFFCAPGECWVRKKMDYGKKEAHVSPTDTKLCWVLPFVPEGRAGRPALGARLFFSVPHV